VEVRQARETLELVMRGSDISVAVVDVPDGELNDSRLTVFNFGSRKASIPLRRLPISAPPARLSIHPDDYDAVLATSARARGS